MHRHRPAWTATRTAAATARACRCSSSRPGRGENYVSHDVTDQSSVAEFIEDNWLRGQRIGGGSFDAIAGSLDARGGVLDFRTWPNFEPIMLDPTTGEVVSGWQ